MKILKSGSKNFTKALEVIAGRGDTDNSSVEQTVKSVISDVRARGDSALIDFSARFDGVTMKAGAIKLKRGEMKKAERAIPASELALLNRAAVRIEAFHKKQIQPSWYDVDELGTTLGQKITPLRRVGIYVPGGKASYPSSVLMNALPARVAGVAEIYMVTPPQEGGIDPLVLASASICGVKAVYQVGGAQAVAALAYGTRSVKKVDKIVGPGNIYVATAKRLVFGAVDIDMIAGPSEILVIGDGSGEPSWIAADLLSQAEHDELASAIFVTTSVKEAKAVSAQVELQLKKTKRAKIAQRSIDSYGLILLCKDLPEAARISNAIAPEHLELMVEDPFKLLKSIDNAGAVFLGGYTPEAVGDYMAGPNHTLPTGGTARFSSPLGTYDFFKRTSIISFSKKGFQAIQKDVKKFADLEGFGAHAKSASIRRATKKTV